MSRWNIYTKGWGQAGEGSGMSIEGNEVQSGRVCRNRVRGVSPCNSEGQGYGYTRGFCHGYSHGYGYGSRNPYPAKTCTRGSVPTCHFGTRHQNVTLVCVCLSPPGWSSWGWCAHLSCTNSKFLLFVYYSSFRNLGCHGFSKKKVVFSKSAITLSIMIGLL